MACRWAAPLFFLRRWWAVRHRLLAVLDALLFAAAVLSLAAAFLAPWLCGRCLYGAQKGPSPPGAASLPGQAAEAVQPLSAAPAGGGAAARPLTVLLLGLDARPGEPSGRSDAIVVARYDPVKNELRLLSVPRDTLAEIPGHGRDKINSACALGGPELAREAVSRLLGVGVDRCLAFRWEGFVRAVDLLGGVELEVESDMHHADSSAGTLSEIDLRAGKQRLDGLRALQYARWRGDGRGDIGRVERQQKLLKALVTQATRPENLPRLPRAAAEALRCCDTDMPVPEALALLGAVLARGAPTVEAATLPGRAEMIGGVSYWVVDRREAREFAENFLHGLVVATISQDSGNTLPIQGSKYSQR